MRKIKSDNYRYKSEVIIKPSFYDFDPMRVLWHGNYLKLFETAREKLLEKIGYTYVDMLKEGYAFPIVEANVKYRDYTQYGDCLCVIAFIYETECLLKIGYEVYDDKKVKLKATGYTHQVCCTLSDNEVLFVLPESVKSHFTEDLML